MERCPHGVYDPSGKGKAEYCSVCTPPKPLTDEEAKIFHGSVTHDLPHKDKRCPQCGSAKFHWVNEWDFHCKECSFDALTA